MALKDLWDEDDSRRDMGAGVGGSGSGDSRRSQVCPSAATLYITGGARGGWCILLRISISVDKAVLAVLAWPNDELSG